jgi:Tuberculosis necrotizing toxin
LKPLVTAAWILIATLTGAAQAECYLPFNARTDLRMLWLQADCNYVFPPRDGFAGAAKVVRLRPGTVVDRFGHPGGRFLAPADASYMGRAVPYDRFKMPYYPTRSCARCASRPERRRPGSTSPAAECSTRPGSQSRR